MGKRRDPESVLSKENRELKRTVENLRRQVSRLRKQLGKTVDDFEEPEEEVAPVIVPKPSKLKCSSCQSEDVTVLELATPVDVRVYHVCAVCGKKKRVGTIKKDQPR